MTHYGYVKLVNIGVIIIVIRIPSEDNWFKEDFFDIYTINNILTRLNKN